LRRELTSGGPIGPSAMFQALRMRTEALGYAPDAVAGSLLALPGLVESLDGPDQGA